MLDPGFAIKGASIGRAWVLAEVTGCIANRAANERRASEMAEVSLPVLNQLHAVRT
jgi:hypothetical protein